VTDQDDGSQSSRDMFAAFSAVFGALFFLVGLGMLVYGFLSKPVTAGFLAAGVVAVLIGVVLIANAVQLDREG
jgi:hypothetical protein